ncbi:MULTISPECIES: hypothetical protein [unclassified Blastomonas]|uniref:hypothetical protein n=1 Tax=unclassified Blastomonas TaxID=2626550 RepID=UPI000824032A|nr:MULTISPECIES: hypothetical protein [unclassified Blastomonas]
MTYEQYRAEREAEEAQRAAERQARRQAAMAMTPEQRQAELEAMPHAQRYLVERMIAHDTKLADQIATLTMRVNGLHRSIKALTA